jgi:hypothetical protein
MMMKSTLLVLLICILLCIFYVDSSKVNVNVNVGENSGVRGIRKYLNNKPTANTIIPVQSESELDSVEEDDSEASFANIGNRFGMWSSPRCTQAGGRCIATCPNGRYRPNMACPGPQNIRCCVPNGSQPQPPPPQPNNGGGGSGEISGIPMWSQKDPRWAGIKYAFSAGTIGSVGCTMTSLAMASAWKSGNEGAWTPDRVNQNYGGALKAAGPFKNLGRLATMYDTDYGTVSKAASGPLVESIRNELRAGHPVFIGMLFPQRIEAERWNRHTVLATGVRGDGDVILHDPATGQQGSLNAYMNRPQFTGFDKASSISR